MSKPVSLPYRDGVGMMLLNRDGLVFVAKRIDMRAEAWQMPQGGIDKGENPRACAMRELREEIGTDKAEILHEAPGWYYYDLPKDLVPKIWNGKYRGQRQKWFLLQFTGEDNDINIETENPEFLEWKWVKPAQLPELIVLFKRELYAKLVRDFQAFLKV